MAGEDGQERTEEPTAKKLQDARNKGQVPRSRELATALVTVAAAASLLMMGGNMGQGFVAYFVRALSPESLVKNDPSSMASQFYLELIQGLLIMWPLMLVCFIAAVLAAIALGGWVFKFNLKLDQLDPIKGIGRIFSTNSLVELLKSILKVVFIGWGSYLLMSMLMPDVLNLAQMDPRAALIESGSMLLWFFLMCSLPLIIIALIDVPWQLFNYKKQLMMTRQEILDEFKESEGRPEVKAKIREMAQAVANRRMMEKVPDADVIITNPTHFAVALKYDSARGSAPVVVAKGVDEMAGRIRQLGGEHKVALVASPKLARALYASTDLDREIPSGLYLAVAQVLTYVYQLRQWQEMGGEYPEMPEPDVADEFLEGL